jgi:uncharacterized protein (TIGR02453 family)
MAFFTTEYTDFFKELERNNHKEWFDLNRKRYEKIVKDPFKKFQIALTDSVQHLHPEVPLPECSSIMRINRDIRFSKDKTPYKIHNALMILPGGKKDKTTPGMFVQANHVDVRMYSGAHMIEKDQLSSLRWHIKDNLDEFNKLIINKDFKSTFSEILGDKNKRLPVDFRDCETKQPLIANKSFYWYAKLPSTILYSTKLIDELVSLYKTSLPLNKFITEGLRN